MGILNIFKQPQEEVRMANTGTLLEYISGNNHVNVNEENIMQVAGVKNAVDLISGTISSFPVYLYDKKGNKVKDNRIFLINNEPNNFEIGSNFKRGIVKDLLLNGSSYCLINKKGLEIKGLYPIEYNSVTKTDVIDKNGFLVDKRYNFVMNNISLEKNFFNILEIEYNKGILKECSDFLQTLLYINEFDNNIFKNSILPSGVLETEGRLTQENAKSIKEQLERLYASPKNALRPMILEQGLKWKQIYQKPNDLMLDKAKIEAVKDIERMFNLPYGMLNNVTNQSVVDQNSVFLNRTLTPILTTLEEAFDKCLLLESEKKEGYYFRFDISELMRLSPDKMLEYVRGLEEGSYITHEQACIILDQEPIEKLEAPQEPPQEPQVKEVIEVTQEEDGSNGEE